jgi:hypothetical protein
MLLEYLHRCSQRYLLPFHIYSRHLPHQTESATAKEVEEAEAGAHMSTPSVAIAVAAAAAAAAAPITLRTVVVV